MATPMRSSLQEGGHRARVAESSSGHATAKPDTCTLSSTQPQPTNFEYDDNEWDVGIGDLVIDLDADIEKTNEVASQPTSMAANTALGNAQTSKNTSTAKMHIEHSATADKGLKMKIKRTKPGSKTSEAKHEIVKSNEQNGSADQTDIKDSTMSLINKHNAVANPAVMSVSSSNTSSSNNKRGSGSHRRDKIRDKHGSSSSTSSSSTANDKSNANNAKGSSQSSVNVNIPAAEVNGIIRMNSSQPGPPRPLFPVSTGPGPPQNSPRNPSESSPGPPLSPSTGQGQGIVKAEQGKCSADIQMAGPESAEDQSQSPPPTKKMKTETKETANVCVGTSVGTITEPDCLGPCEPGTSVTLEGIVWHETEGGVLVVNVTWRGKTYVGTLLDCTRHDWAPPRFCDSPTSDLDNRTPKGRETRSSVNSKLRNAGGIAVKGRRGGSNGSGSSTTPSSPTPFVLPRPESSNKRKSRVGEEESSQANNGSSKKSKVIVPPPANPLPTTSTPCSSPPPSPVLLECPEPNCSKKYKHINGLKYHQSHAHGSADDDDTKDVTSMSENDESNIEAPSPATPVKSPEKSQDSPMTPLKKETEVPNLLRSSNLLEMPGQSVTPRSTPPSPATPQSIQESPATVRSPSVTEKSIVKPGVLRYPPPEEYPVNVFAGNKNQVQGIQNPSQHQNPQSTTTPLPESEQPRIEQPRNEPENQTQTFTSQLPTTFTQPPSIIVPHQNNPSNNPLQAPLSPQPVQSPSSASKVSQFKVKPASALMPEEKKGITNKPQIVTKKKNRKSPAGSPLSPQQDEMMFDAEKAGRDEVQSPAYSDISDDGTPVVDSEMTDKNKTLDKKVESGHNLTPMSQYGMYHHPFYGQTHPYMMQQSAQENNPKEPEVQEEKSNEKEPKKDNPDYPQKVLQHYYPYGYVPSYPYNMDSNYGGVSLVQDDKMKEERPKETPSPAEPPVKAPPPVPNPIQVPTAGKMKPDSNPKDKQSENHQILKESIEMKNQMSSFMYSRPPANSQPQQQPPQQIAQPQQQQPHHGQREEDLRRFYVYSDQKRKESQQSVSEKNNPTVSKGNLPQSPSMKVKEIKIEDKKDKEVKQEGVKPTMETQGPPPPPTSQYYIHPSYMQQAAAAAHYGALPFDPNHPMYRSIMVPGPYSGSPYLHAPPIQRYHAPEDLSRPPPPSAKALDMLQHHAQYYSSHKIHELQERAIKSPTPKTSMASSSPSIQSSGPPSSQSSQPNVPSSQVTNAPTSGKQTPGDNNKESRSPPPQRHVHTHHHTHVGLGYPMYPAPYGAAVLASQQAAAVTVINPYPTK